MKKFPIGFWNYAPANNPKAMCVRDWVDAGMTLAMSPVFDPARDDKDAFRRMLDESAEAGIRVIVSDERSHWDQPETDEAAYRAGFAEALADFGDHPAVLGFHVGDEPQGHQFDGLCKAYRIQKEMSPKLSPFANLPGTLAQGGWVGRFDWSAYLDEYVQSARPDMLSTDTYTQMYPGQEGWDAYFENLREYEAAARRNNVPLWVTLLSVGHFRYRCPKEDDLRWQISTAVAHGAKGLMWFFLYMRQPDCNYRVAPIDEHWERTETFEWLSRVNRTFLKGPADTLMGLELQTVGHVGRAWGGWPEFNGEGRLHKVKSVHGTDLIASQFTDPTGRDWVAVVNNSQTDSTQAELWFRGRRPKVFHLQWLGEETQWHTADNEPWLKGNDYLQVNQWLAPGQLELFRVEDA